MKKMRRKADKVSLKKMLVMPLICMVMLGMMPAMPSQMAAHAEDVHSEDVHTEEIPPASVECTNPGGHKFDSEPSKTQEATCTENGALIYKCKYCDFTISEMLRAKGHDWSKGDGVCAVCHASCVHDWHEDSIELSTCTICHMVCKHEEKTAVKGKAATCTETGLTKGSHCSVCGKVLEEQEVIPVTDHTEITDEAKAATCTKTGLTEGSHCSVCGKVLKKQETVPALGHSWSEEGTCSVCGDPCEHSWRPGEDSADYGYCTICGMREYHKEVKWDVAEEQPTCTEPGHTGGSHCALCGIAVNIPEKIPAAGHTEAPDAAVEATCTETGLTEGSHCSVCGEVLKEQKEIPAAGHEEKVAIEAKAATCAEAGHTAEIICSVCGETLRKQEEVPAAEHTEVTDAAVAATCTATGLSEGSHCSVCGETLKKQEEVPAAGHSWEAISAEKVREYEAASTEGYKKDGKTAAKQCSICGEFDDYQFVGIIIDFQKKDIGSSGSSGSGETIGKIGDEEKTIGNAGDNSTPVVIIPFKDNSTQAENYVETIVVEKPKKILSVYFIHENPVYGYDEDRHFIVEDAMTYQRCLNDPEWEVLPSAYPYKPHSFTRNKDGCKCTVCGYVRKSHTWTDGGEKKHRCSVCGYEKDHSFRYADDSKEKCESCGRVRSHSFVNANGGKNHVCFQCWVVQKDHRWENDGNKDRCKDCGTKRDHEYKYYNSGYDKCQRCGKLQGHLWKDNHKKNKDECKVCHTLKDHNWGDGGKKKCSCKDCSAKTKHRWADHNASTEKCRFCGKTRGHDWKNNKKKGKDECKQCGRMTDHKKGTNGKCKRCGKKM